MAIKVPRGLRRGLWLCLVVASGVVVAGGLVCYAWRSSAPRYQGKTSAEWFREFQEAASRHWTVLRPTPTVSARVLDARALLQEPATAGLRALGTNAAVYLGHEYAREDGRLARTYRQLYLRLPLPIRSFVPKPPVPRSYHRMEIAWALEALGPDASVAAPSLIAALRRGDQFTFQTTLTTLRKIGFDGPELDPLLEDWSKVWQHTNVVRVVSDLHVRTTVALRCLTAALTGGDTALRRSSVCELERWGAAAAPALPELTAALKDPDDQVRYEAARALEAIGSSATTAIPALVQATNDTSVMVQRASARALRVIQGLQTE